MLSFTLRQLEYFDAVAEAGSIAGAARACHVSESTIAAALDELERALGVALLVRRRAHGATLAADGRIALERARTILEASRELERIGSEQGLAGPVSIGVYGPFAGTLLPRILARLDAEHPEASVRIVDDEHDELLRALREGELDVALVYDVDLGPELAARPIATRRPHALLPDGHPLAERRSVRLSELADEPFVRFDYHPSSQNTAALFARAGIAPPTRLSTHHFELVRSLVGEGLGWSLVYQVPASDVTESGRPVAAVPIELADGEPGAISLVAAVRSGAAARSPRLRTLVAIAADAARAHP